MSDDKLNEDKLDKNTKAEIEAGRNRVKDHDVALRAARAVSEEQRKDDPRLMKPYIAGEDIDKPDFVRLEGESEEDAEARKAAVLAREEAIMKAREGGTPDPRFDPDAAEAERKRQAELDTKAAEEQKARDEAAAKIKAQVKATGAADTKGIDDADRRKAEEGKKAEGEAKAGEPDDADKKPAKKSAKNDDGDSVLDDLLKS